MPIEIEIVEGNLPCPNTIAAIDTQSCERCRYFDKRDTQRVPVDRPGMESVYRNVPIVICKYPMAPDTKNTFAYESLCAKFYRQAQKKLAEGFEEANVSSIEEAYQRGLHPAHRNQPD